MVLKRNELLVPKKRKDYHIRISKFLTQEQDHHYVIPVYSRDDNFLSLVHVALKLRLDILTHSQYKGFKVSKKAVRSCIPDGVFMFLKVLFSGKNVLNTPL